MQRFSCSLGEETCKGDITFPDSVAECVTVGGVLFDGSTVGQVLIRETPRICASRPLSKSKLVTVYKGGQREWSAPWWLTAAQTPLLQR